MNHIEASIRESSQLRNRLIRCHIQYAEERWNSLSQKDQELLADSNNQSIERMIVMRRDSRVSGTNFTMYAEGDRSHSTDLPSIKCLHAHYARFVSTTESLEFPTPVGEMVHEALQKGYPFLKL